MRHQGLDILRLIAAFSIVTLHFEPYAAIPRDLLEGIWLGARYAVPVFFIASGFLLQPKFAAAPESVLRNLAHLAAIFCYASLAYVPWRLIRGAAWNDFLDLGLFTGGTAFHLWFLPSLGFGILILAIFHISHVRWLMTPVAIVLLAAYITANDCQNTTDSQLNFLRFLSSIPFLVLGLKIREHRAQSTEHRAQSTEHRARGNQARAVYRLHCGAYRIAVARFRILTGSRSGKWSTTLSTGLGHDLPCRRSISDSHFNPSGSLQDSHDSVVSGCTLCNRHLHLACLVDLPCQTDLLATRYT